MKIKKSWLLPALLGVVGGIAGITSASAATIAAGDVIIGFRATGGAGISQTYLVNLGSSSQFTSLDGVSTTLSLGIATDLAAQFGNNWATRADLSWGVVGYGEGTVTNPTLYASKARTNVNTKSISYNIISRGNRVTTAGLISPVAVGNGYGFANLTDTLSSTAQAVFQDSSLGYGSGVSTGASDFGTVSGWNSIEGNFGNGATGTVLDFYRFTGNNDNTGNTTTYLGNFSITSGGVVTFNSFSAVPEPAAPLLGAIGTLFLLGSRRRRSH